MNHGFVDGNKQIAFGAMVIFMDMNDMSVTASQEEAESFILSNLKAVTFIKDVLDEWLRAHTEKR